MSMTDAAHPPDRPGPDARARRDDAPRQEPSEDAPKELSEDARANADEQEEAIAGDPDTPNPVLQEIEQESTGSAIAVVGHPVHAMLVHFPIALVIGGLGLDVFYWYTGDPFWLRAGIWTVGFAFWSGVLASLVGTAELLMVKGIRVRVASWSHAVAAMTLIAAIGTNWGLRLYHPEAVLPHGLALSVLSSVLAGLAGWHGGKLVFDHGVGIMVSPHR